MAENHTLILPRTHNMPPADQVISDELDPDVVRARLDRDHADMVKRFIELEIGAGQCPKHNRQQLLWAIVAALAVFLAIWLAVAGLLEITANYIPPA